MNKPLAYGFTLLIALLAFGCSPEKDEENAKETDPCATVPADSSELLADYQIESERGYCYLEKGYFEKARNSFDFALDRDQNHSPANFGYGLAVAVETIDMLYSGAYELSLSPDENFNAVRTVVFGPILGNRGDLPKKAERIDRGVERLRSAAADPTFRRSLEGWVLRLRLLEVFIGRHEVDSGEAAGVASLLQIVATIIEFISAYNLETKTEYILNEGRPIYSILKFDLDGALTDVDFGDFFDRGDDAEEWLSLAAEHLKGAIEDMRSAITLTVAEGDNQAMVDLPDYPDLISKAFFTFEGSVHIPSIFGPASTRAILPALFGTDRKGTIEMLAAASPDSPPRLPDLFLHVLDKLDSSLVESQSITLLGLTFILQDVFEIPLPLRQFLQLFAAGSGDSGSSGSIVGLTTGAMANRVTEETIPWEHPELFPDDVTLTDLEADPLRGVDGPAAELHIGNGCFLAGITREGRLKNLFYPGVTSYNLVPYITRARHPFLEYEPIPLIGANPEHGSFAGLIIDGDITWLHDWLNPRTITPSNYAERPIRPRYEKPGSGLGLIDYNSDDHQITVAESVFAPKTGEGPEPATLVRRFEVTNRAESRRKISFVYYGAFNVVNIDQFTLSPKFDDIWLRATNDLLVGADGSLTWTGPGWADNINGPYTAVRLYGESGTGAVADTVVTGYNDDRHRITGAFGKIERGESEQGDSIFSANFAGGALIFNLGTLEANQTVAVDIFITASSGYSTDYASENAAMDQSEALGAPDRGAEATRGYWDDYTDSLVLPEALSEKEYNAMLYSGLALKLGQSSLTGAIAEMLDMQPMWFMTWPGNGIWHALAFDALGRTTEAGHYLDFLRMSQSVQGYWRMAYNNFGAEHLAFEIEYYQTGLPLYFGWAHWQLTGDDNQLLTFYPMWKKAADFLISRIARNGLVYASPDYVEDPTAFRQSLYTASSVIAGLRSAAAMADYRGESEDAASWRAGADRIAGAARDTFIDEETGGFFAQFDMHGRWGHGFMSTMSVPLNAFAPDSPQTTAHLEEYLDRRYDEQNYITFEEPSIDWSPGLSLDAFFYMAHWSLTGREESRTRALDIIDGLLYWPTLTGFIPERHFGYGVTGSGHPLLWPHSYLVLAEHTRDGTLPIPLAPDH